MQLRCILSNVDLIEPHYTVIPLVFNGHNYTSIYCVLLKLLFKYETTVYCLVTYY